MIVPDVNLLLYASDEASPHHEAALAWWSRCLAGPEVVGIPWVTTLAFLRLTTNPRVYSDPVTVEQALAVVDQWFSYPHVVALEPTSRHLGILSGLLRPTGAGANLVTDAHLAAVAIENGAALCSADADFSRFPGLTWKNPLAS